MFPFCFNDSMHESWHGLHNNVQILITHVIPAWSDSVQQNYLWSQKAWLAQSSSAPINVQCSWGQVTVEDSPWQPGLLGLPWSILLQYESFSTKIKPEGGARRRHNSPRLEFSHQHLSLWVWNTVVSFSLLFISLHTPFCYWHISQTYTQ